MKSIKGGVVAVLICVSQLFCRNSVAENVNLKAYSEEPLGVAILTVPENLNGDPNVRSFPMEELGVTERSSVRWTFMSVASP